jgi:predicted GIY-YIG superfamily endonuclease
MKSRKNKNPSTDKVPHSTVVIPYIRGISEKLRRIGNRYNIRTIFKTKHIPWGTLMTIRPDRGLEQTMQCVCSIPCECGRCYIGETSRPLQVRIKEHKHNLRQGLLEKPRLAKLAYEEGHKICWNEARVLQTEPNIIYRKYKESAHMSLLVNPISQPSLDISPIWIPVISEEVGKLLHS